MACYRGPMAAVRAADFMMINCFRSECRFRAENNTRHKTASELTRVPLARAINDTTHTLDPVMRKCARE